MLVYLFLLLPVAAAWGWWMGFRRKQSGQSASPARTGLRQDYFKGLAYLINEQPDKAVDFFIKLLEVDADTVETHLALGGLFRRRGEVDRAIRIHQNLIARPQLPKQYRLEALSALGQDYLHAGVLDRAERLFLEIVAQEDMPIRGLHFLLQIYQQERDWHKAIKTAQKLQSLGEPMSQVIAQYYCELAEQLCQKNLSSEAMHYLKRARSIDPKCVRANLLCARLAAAASNLKEAIRCYKRVVEQDPAYLADIIEPLMSCYEALGESDRAFALLKRWLQEYPRLALVLVMSRYLRLREGDHSAMTFLVKQLQSYPSLKGLKYLMEMVVVNVDGMAREHLTLLTQFVDRLLESKPLYQCVQCGFSGKTLFWACPSCHQWNAVKPLSMGEA